MNDPYLHILEADGIELPSAFTYPFRYTPHPLCRKAVCQVVSHLQQLNLVEGKMYGVLVVQCKDNGMLYFLAAHSGQIDGGYNDPWFVPPVVDYLQPDGYFMQEQAEIIKLNKRIAAWHRRESRVLLEQKKHMLESQRDKQVVHAKEVYQRNKGMRTIKESQQQKADIRRAKHLFSEELAQISSELANDNAALQALQSERKQRSEALQQWLFQQFTFNNARGQQASLISLFPDGNIPSGAGECCAPKLLQTAYQLGLHPLCMAEFWWGPSPANEERTEGEYYPACHRKCLPILNFMLQGLDVAPDPAAHYNDVSANDKPRVVWEDEWYAAIDKPAGWLSVQGKADLPCIQDYARHIWPEATGPLVVHRLDQDTSGLLLIAKTAEAHRRAQHLFERRQIRKTYIALLEHPINADINHPVSLEGIISLPLGPDLDHRPRQMVSIAYGLEATTHYKVLDEDSRRIAFYPETGRTHQLRVHAASPQGLNNPILGDRLYGHLDKRLYLHATTLCFIHPYTHEQLRIDSPCPF